MEEETQFIQDFFNQETYTIVWEPSENTKKAHEYRDNKQFDKALELYTKEAENGDAEAQYCLGFMYEFNKHFGIPNDKSNYAKSMFWYKTSADNHHYGAQLEYGKKCIVASHGDINQINEGLNYLAKAADSNATKRMEAMSEYIDTVISRKTGKETIIKAIEYCDKIADTPKVSFEKEQALKKKAILEEQLKNIQPAKKQKTNRTNGCRGCLVAVLVAIIGLVIIAIVINSANKALGNKSALSTQETVSTVAFGEEMIELHNIDPVEQQQITMKSTSGYTVDNTLWDGAFIYRAGNGDNTAYAIYDIGGHFEKVEFEATPWLGEGNFFESSTADIMIINAETNDIIYTETINYNSGVMTIEADITGVDKLGIYVKKTNGMLAYIFIKDVYLYPEGMVEETSDSYKITGNIRSGAGMDYDIILASDGSTVYVATGNKVVISEDSEWYEVYIDEEKTTTGWCHSSIAEKQ